MKLSQTLLMSLIAVVFTKPIFADFNDGWNEYSNGNYNQALKEWIPLANQGDGLAQFNLAGLYSKGYGVKIDDEEAFNWFKKSAEQGIAKAQYNVGVMYLNAIGVDKSYSEAKYWLNLSYENGIKDAEVLWNKHKLWNH